MRRGHTQLFGGGYVSAVFDAVVIGGGNIWRGLSAAERGMDRPARFLDEEPLPIDPKVFHRQIEYYDAIQSYQTAATADPTKATTYEFNEGAVLTNTGKIDQAIAVFDKVIAADPTKADAYYWKGVNLMGKATLKGNKMEAPAGTQEAFNKYLELAPTGQFADPAKQMLASMGATVETSFGKGKKK